MRIFAVGNKWPALLGESLATELTWYGCMVPNFGCAKYDRETTVCIVYTAPVSETGVIGAG